MVRLSALAVTAAVLSGQSLIAALNAADIPSGVPVSALLNSAQAHLHKGETNDALLYFDAAIARDPSNYLTFFKRATMYLSLNRLAQATDDFNKVLSLKPGFDQAHAQLGRIKARSADWDAAREQYLLAKKKKSDDMFVELEEAQRAARSAEDAENKGQWSECADNADVAIQLASRSVTLRERRARCRFADGQTKGGISDLLHVLQMKPGDTSPHVNISAINFYAFAERSEGRAQIRKCLHSDPDSKICKRLLKELTATDKALQKAEKELASIRNTRKELRAEHPLSAIKQLVPRRDEEGLVKEVKSRVQSLREDSTIPALAPNDLVAQMVALVCEAYYLTDKKGAKEYCEESLQLDENALYGMLFRAKAQLQAEDYEAGVTTLKKALEIHPGEGATIRPMLQEAELDLKRSKTKDYYKVLGVARDADDRQIKSAYRKMSKQHHPDKAINSELTKEEAEKKMAAINEAYEVLSDPELRARFDRGDDPNSHEQQNPFQGRNPFANGRPFMYQQSGGRQQQQHFQFQFGNGFPGGF